MRRVGVFGGCIVLALLAGGSSSFAVEQSPQSPIELQMDASLGVEDASGDERASIADVHAQFAPVVTPGGSTLSLDEWSNHVLIYTGIDAWRLGGSAYFGSEWSPSADSPFILRAFASDGIDDYKTPFGTYRVQTARASVMAGYRIKSGALDLKLFAGGDFMLRSLLRPALGLWKDSYGARVGADVWWEPTPNWMLSGAVSATTIERGITGRLASGWRSPFAWIGPELLATHDVFNTQYRAGVHISGFQIGMTEWSLAGGYSTDSFGRGGAYARLGISYRSLP